MWINPLNAELNPIRHLLALVGVRHFVHGSRIRVNVLQTCRLIGYSALNYGGSSPKGTKVQTYMNICQLQPSKMWNGLVDGIATNIYDENDYCCN